MKTDSIGNEQWYRTFGGAGRDEGVSVKQTGDGGYIVVGHTYSFGEGEADVYLIKTDSNGNEQWHKTFGGNATDAGQSIDLTSDGGYIIVGHTWSYGAGDYDVYLIKTDSDGNKQWQRTFGGSNQEWAFSVQHTSDNGFIISGTTLSFGAGGWDVYLIKTDAVGNLQWEKTYGGSGTDWGGYSIQQTNDGGYITTGRTDSFGEGSFDVYLIKIDPEGVEEWQETYGGIAADYSMSVKQTTDDGYIISGQTESYGEGGYDVYLIKLGLINNPPIANAGTSLDGNNKLQLDGTLSYDPDGDLLNFVWQINGEVDVRVGQIVSISDLPIGNYTVTLTVSDGTLSVSDTMLFGVPEGGGATPPSPDELQQQVQNIKDLLTGFSINCFDAPNNKAAENRKKALLNMLDKVSEHIDASDYQAAIDQLNDILAKSDGLNPPDSAFDWIIDDPATGDNEQQEVAQMASHFIGDLESIH